MVLSCEIGTRKGTSVEEYELEALAASAEAVMPGLGPLAVRLARLADTAGGVQALDVMVAGVAAEGRELLRGVAQLGVDGLAATELRGSSTGNATSSKNTTATTTAATPPATA